MDNVKKFLNRMVLIIFILVFMQQLNMKILKTLPGRNLTLHQILPVDILLIVKQFLGSKNIKCLFNYQFRSNKQIWSFLTKKIWQTSNLKPLDLLTVFYYQQLMKMT